MGTTESMTNLLCQHLAAAVVGDCHSSTAAPYHAGCWHTIRQQSNKHVVRAARCAHVPQHVEELVPTRAAATAAANSQIAIEIHYLAGRVIKPTDGINSPNPNQGVDQVHSGRCCDVQPSAGVVDQFTTRHFFDVEIFHLTY